MARRLIGGERPPTETKTESFTTSYENFRRSSISRLADSLYSGINEKLALASSLLDKLGRKVPSIYEAGGQDPESPNEATLAMGLLQVFLIVRELNGKILTTEEGNTRAAANDNAHLNGKEIGFTEARAKVSKLNLAIMEVEERNGKLEDLIKE